MEVPFRSTRKKRFTSCYGSTALDVQHMLLKKKKKTEQIKTKLILKRTFQLTFVNIRDFKKHTCNLRAMWMLHYICIMQALI